MTLTVETETEPAGFVRLAAEWDAMDLHDLPRTPFQSPIWHRLWWKHFQRTGLKVRDELRLYAVRDLSGTLVAIAPMMLTHRPGNLPIRTRELQFLGADSNVTEIRGMVCREGWSSDAVAALAGHFAKNSEWDWVQWRGLPAKCALPGAGFRLTKQLQDFYLPLPSSWETLRASLPRNMKEALRKCYNSLSRDGHAYEMAVLTDPAEVRAGLQNLLAMHAMRSQQDGTVHHIDVFAAPQARAFITEYVDEMAKAGAVRLFALSIGGKAVAMRIGFAYENELYLYYSGYDPAWGRYSVMTTVVAEAIKWAIAQGNSRVNLSTGADVSKTRWRPAQVDFVEGVQPSETWRGQIAMAAMEMMRDRKWVPPFQRPKSNNAQSPGRHEMPDGVTA